MVQRLWLYNATRVCVELKNATETPTESLVHRK